MDVRNATNGSLGRTEIRIEYSQGITLSQLDPAFLGPEHVLSMPHESAEIERRSKLARALFDDFASRQQAACPVKIPQISFSKAAREQNGFGKELSALSVR